MSTLCELCEASLIFERKSGMIEQKRSGNIVWDFAGVSYMEKSLVGRFIRPAVNHFVRIGCRMQEDVI